QQQQPLKPEASPHARRNGIGIHEACAKFRQKIVIAVRIFAHIGHKWVSLLPASRLFAAFLFALRLARMLL
ncbi:hypothetical protein ACMTAU_20100, partial [Alcaligenes pakistanensis]